MGGCCRSASLESYARAPRGADASAHFLVDQLRHLRAAHPMWRRARADPAKPAIACKVTYTCTAGVCDRAEAPLPGQPGTTTTQQLVSGLSSSAVFGYSPDSTNPDYVTMRLVFPAAGGDDAVTLDGRRGSAEPMRREGGFTVVELLMAVADLRDRRHRRAGHLRCLDPEYLPRRGAQVAINRAQRELEQIRRLAYNDVALTTTPAASSDPKHPATGSAAATSRSAGTAPLRPTTPRWS